MWEGVQDDVDGLLQVWATTWAESGRPLSHVEWLARWADLIDYRSTGQWSVLMVRRAVVVAATAEWRRIPMDHPIAAIVHHWTQDTDRLARLMRARLADTASRFTAPSGGLLMSMNVSIDWLPLSTFIERRDRADALRWMARTAMDMQSATDAGERWRRAQAAGHAAEAASRRDWLGRRWSAGNFTVQQAVALVLMSDEEAGWLNHLPTQLLDHLLQNGPLPIDITDPVRHPLRALRRGDELLGYYALGMNGVDDRGGKGDQVFWLGHPWIPPSPR